ncbi:MAG: hypothetical protein U0Y10_22755 [Spirosomataceae bacterium]
MIRTLCCLSPITHSLRKSIAQPSLIFSGGSKPSKTRLMRIFLGSCAGLVLRSDKAGMHGACRFLRLGSSGRPTSGGSPMPGVPA